MTRLRRQLDSLREEYAAEAYPGDLASQLLRGSLARPRPMGLRLVLGCVGGALAAGLALAVLFYDPASRAVENSVRKLAQAADLPFLGVDDEAAALDHFSIIPEFRTPHLSIPPDPAPQESA